MLKCVSIYCWIYATSPNLRTTLVKIIQKFETRLQCWVCDVDATLRLMIFLDTPSTLKSAILGSTALDLDFWIFLTRLGRNDAYLVSSLVLANALARTSMLVSLHQLILVSLHELLATASWVCEQTDRQADRQTGRQAGRQAYIHI